MGYCVAQTDSKILLVSRNVSLVVLYSLVRFTETEGDERGEVYSWGSGQYGRLGHGNLHDRFLPLRISSPLDSVDAVHVACGEFHSAVVSGELHAAHAYREYVWRSRHGMEEAWEVPRQVYW